MASNEQGPALRDDATGRELAVTEQLSALPASINGVQRAVFLPANFGEAMQMARLMSSGLGVRAIFRGNDSACLMLVQQSIRWGMDPYAVANKAYVANDQVCFESQLVNAVVNTSGRLLGRLRISYTGDTEGGPQKESLVCTVQGRTIDDPEHWKELEQPLKTITIRNSPLWKVNPKLQLAYHATRSWARLYMPEVLLGVYTQDEVIDGEAMMLAEKTRPATTAAPDRRNYTTDEPERVNRAAETAAEGEEAQFEPVEEESTVIPAENAQSEPENVEKEPEKAGNQGDSTPKTAPKSVDWAAYERELKAVLDEAQSIDEVNSIKRTRSEVEAEAPSDVEGRLSDLYMDAIVDLTGK